MALLTKRKEKWVRQFKPQILKGSPMNPNISDAMRYQKKLDALINNMTKDVEKEIRNFFRTSTAKDYFAQDDSISSQARIMTNALMKKFNDIFAIASKPLAEQVVSEANKSSTFALHSSLEQLSGGLSIKTSSISEETLQILNASVTENVNLIKSISEHYLNGVQQAVMRSITSGGGLNDLIPYLQRSKEITHKRAKMIALDQTRKAFNSINKGKMDNLGIKKFEWLHTGGSNAPRKDHIEMSGKIFSFDNLPVIDKNTGERGIPGQAINCRCRMAAVISFNED